MAAREKMAVDGRRRECYFVDPQSRRKETALLSSRMKSPDAEKSKKPRLFSKLEQK